MTSPGGPRGRRREGWGRAGAGLGSGAWPSFPAACSGRPRTRLRAEKDGAGFSQPPLCWAAKGKISRGQGQDCGETWPPGSSRRGCGGGGAGWIHGKVNSPLLCFPPRPALHPWSLHPCDFTPPVSSVGSWLGCWCSCRAPGPEPAPARWRGALRRAALHSLSRLPLFNQIIGKVNLPDSRSPLPPPSPPAHSWLPLPTAPGSSLGTGAWNSLF